MRDTGMDAWSKMMIQLVNTEAYAQATGAMLDAWLTTSAPFRKAIEATMTQALTKLNMPTRADVTSLAERLTNIEMRLDDLEAKLDEGRAGRATAAPAGRDSRRALRRTSHDGHARIADATPSVYAELEKIAENLQTFNRLVTTNAKIAQTPKEVVWTLNKAKLYRYVPVVPAGAAPQASRCCWSSRS